MDTLQELILHEFNDQCHRITIINEYDIYEICGIEQKSESNNNHRNWQGTFRFAISRFRTQFNAPLYTQ